MPSTSLDHKAALEPVLHQVYSRFLAQAVSRGELRALPLATGEYVFFDDPDPKAWFKTVRAQLTRLLTKSSEAIAIDLEWLDAPLLEAIWKARQTETPAPRALLRKPVEPVSRMHVPVDSQPTSGVDQAEAGAGLNERSA